MKRKISSVLTKAYKFHKILIDLRATFVNQSNLNRLLIAFVSAFNSQLRKKVPRKNSLKKIDRQNFWVEIFTHKKIVKGPRDDTKEDNNFIQWDDSLCIRKIK